MDKNCLESKIKNQRCSNCEYCKGITANPGWSFNGCHHNPYKGKWVVEIKDCPRGNK